VKNEFNPAAVIEALQNILPRERDVIALHEPYFNGQEWSFVKDCLDSGWVSSRGRYVDRLEKQLEEYTGASYALAVVNGTAALHICLLLAGVSANDEVLIPALTFVATANAVSYCGAVPHFIDSEERTLGADPYKLDKYLQEIAVVRSGICINKKTGRTIKALIPMHTFGHPADMDPLADLGRTFNLELIEDAAESLGSYYKGQHTGSIGKAAILSFNGNKIITTGGGGAILTNDKSVFDLARHLAAQAKLPHQWSFHHDMVAYNYRMPNINAALGCAQLEQLPAFIEKKRALALRYQEALAGIDGIKVFQEADYARSNYWLNVLILDEEHACHRDRLLELTNKNGIMTRPAWTLMNKLPMYQSCPHMDLSGAESLERRIINLPSSVFL
jgi:perosamine synthetase